MELLLPFLLILAVMVLPMMLMGNRQRKMLQQQQEMINQLEIGDEVRTHSGFYGLLVDRYDDVVILETEDGSQVKWARQAIAAKVDDSATASEADLAEDAPVVAPVDADASDDLNASGTTGKAATTPGSSTAATTDPVTDVDAPSSEREEPLR